MCLFIGMLMRSNIRAHVDTFLEALALLVTWVRGDDVDATPRR